MRKRIPESIQEQVLTLSRRRCCICFGLNRETDIIQGQIAHLDRDNSNSQLGNLAFLCLDHHDEYDTKRSQSKGLNKKEVIKYRDELHAALKDAFSQKVHFGRIHTEPSDPYAGNYTRIGSGTDSAEITLTPLPDTIEAIPRYFLTGFALAGSSKPMGPNMGDLSALVEYDQAGHGSYFVSNLTADGGSTNHHRLILTHDKDTLMVKEELNFAMYGAGVTFSGTYKRQSEKPAG